MIYKVQDFKDEDYLNLVNFWKLTGVWQEERQDSLEMIHSTLNLKGKLFLVKDKIENIIASCWLSYDGRRIHIHHFAVHPDNRRAGIGQTLLDKVFEYAKSRGTQVRLDVEKNNKPAQNLFRKNGMQIYDNYDIMVIRDVSR